MFYAANSSFVVHLSDDFKHVGTSEKICIGQLNPPNWQLIRTSFKAQVLCLYPVDIFFPFPGSMKNLKVVHYIMFINWQNTLTEVTCRRQSCMFWVCFLIYFIFNLLIQWW